VLETKEKVRIAELENEFVERDVSSTVLYGKLGESQVGLYG
jgi:hypothetical protein